MTSTRDLMMGGARYVRPCCLALALTLLLASGCATWSFDANVRGTDAGRVLANTPAVLWFEETRPDHVVLSTGRDPESAGAVPNSFPVTLDGLGHARFSGVIGFQLISKPPALYLCVPGKPVAACQYQYQELGHGRVSIQAVCDLSRS